MDKVTPNTYNRWLDMSIKKAANFGFSTVELLLIIAIVILLGSVIIFEGKNFRQKNRDNTRKNNIVKIQNQVETYQAETGNYPTTAQINSATFRKANLNNFDAGLLKDPSWKETNKNCTLKNGAVLQESITPAPGCLGYKPIPAGCDNKTVDCTSYELTAGLESGGIYQKQSIY